MSVKIVVAPIGDYDFFYIFGGYEYVFRSLDVHD